MSLVFQSQRMHEVLSLAKRYARSSATVLITGESGTGKELLARSIHGFSPRSEKAYVELNCAALPDELVESELFGHEAGAFTGAAARRLGRFEAATGGTLFLDEIGELPKPIQPKLLRVLEDNCIQRVGSNDPICVDARVIAATNRDLHRDVGKSRFREDLYHRLNVLVLHAPPLRQRKEDIPPLVQHFVERFGAQGELRVRGVGPGVMQTLSRYDWPGNIRELRNVICRACVLATTDLIEQVDLPQEAPAEPAASPLPEQFQRLPLREIERRVILARLKVFDGNRTRAAEALGVTTRTLRNKISEYRKLEAAG